jgi:predicted transcriptional regulator
MKFNNIDRNILHLLGNKWLKSKSLGPHRSMGLFDRFSEIPDKNLKDALDSLKAKGLVEFSSNYRDLSLTQKGLSKIKVIKLPENGKFPIPKKLD